MFQSPSRDSGGLKFGDEAVGELARPVSIPQSGFWWVEVDGMQPSSAATAVSIPQSGFWWVEAVEDVVWHLAKMVSIPQSGFWWVEAEEPMPRVGPRVSFNPPVGILVG